MNRDEMYLSLGVSDKVLQFGEAVLDELKPRFAEIEEIAELNQAKVIGAMQKNRVNATHFAASTGYGYDDEGRDNLERVYASAFHTEAALVRPQITCGTHALAIALSANLLPGDEMLAISGKPYDTLEEVIGLRESPCSLKEYGVSYGQVDLREDGSFDFPAIERALNDKTKLIHIQRSKGYCPRPTISVDSIGEAIAFCKKLRPDVVIMVDNCYGEFVEANEPSDLGADMIVGSLIKNPGGTEISWSIIWTYLPVSLLYIGSMTLGYLGLRYIELSVSSPICNSSGALVAVMTLLFVGGEDYSPLALGAIVLVCVGAIGLGVVDATEDPELRAARQAEGNRKYSKSFLALALPVAYCLLDAAGTFADNRVLETLDEGSANCAYELTFLFAAVLCFIYVVFIKKDRLLPKREAPKYLGAICETAGQFAYIYAIADTSHLAMSAPIISSYCAASVLWSRLFLKEKLSWKHYAMILLVVIGIAVMGVFDI